MEEKTALMNPTATPALEIRTGNQILDMIMNPAKFDHLQRVAKLFADSNLVGKSFEKNPAACFVGLQLAFQLGVDPMMLFQKIYSPGGGKVAIETQVAIAIANQRGVFKGPIEYVFEGQGDTRQCTAKAVLTANGKEVSETIKWETVVKEGWYEKSGSKWKTMPDKMFKYRSAMWLIRTYCPEILLGLSSTDELEDQNIIDVTPRKEIVDPFVSALTAKPNSLQETAKILTENNQPWENDPNENKTQPCPISDEMVNELVEKAGLHVPAKAKLKENLFNSATGNKAQADWTAEDRAIVAKTLQDLIDRNAAHSAKKGQ